MKYTVLLLIIFANFLHASIILQNDKHKYDNFTIHYHYDENSKLNIQEIENLYFAEKINNQFTQGYKYGTAWFKVELVNNSDIEDFVLFLPESIWSSFDLYYKEKNIWKIHKNGLDIPIENRQIQDVFPAFEIKVPLNSSVVLYVKGKTIASQIGDFQIYTKEEYFNPNRTTLSETYIIYAFVLFIFILLNIYNYFSTLKPVYIYYVLYVTVYIVFSFMHGGTYIYLGFPNWHEGLHTFGALTLVVLLLFSKEFLDIKNTYPSMLNTFNILMIMAIVFTFLLAIDFKYATLVSNVFFSSTLFFIIYVTIMIFNHGFISAKYYLIALMFYLPTMAMMAMSFNTFSANTDFTRYSFLAGGFIEIFFFTLILTNRYKNIYKEKMLIQNELIEIKHLNELNLKAEIDKQTIELSSANKLLQEQKNELEVAQERLIKEATIDVLSELYNRRYFFKEANKAFYTANRYEQELSIILIDIDNFKAINDNYGHVFGDTVIKFIATIFKELVRNSDIVARYGGEEFIILMPQTTKEEALELAQRIRLEVQKRTAEKFTTDDDITLSFGVTQVLSTDSDIERTIIRADKGLYEAKNKGKNQVRSV